MSQPSVMFVAAHGLPHSPVECPKVIPTEPLNVETLIGIARGLGFEFNNSVFLCTYEALGVARQYRYYDSFRHMFYFPVMQDTDTETLAKTMVPHPFRRYDFNGGEWVEITDRLSLEYELAPYEDILIINRDVPGASWATIRVRRVLPTAIPEDAFSES